MKLNQMIWKLGENDRLRVLCFMGMGLTRVNLELGDDSGTQAVVRNHAFNSAVNEKLWTTLADFFHGLHFLITDVTTTLAGVEFLLLLLTSQADFVSIDDDHEITGIDVRGKDRVVFTTDQVGGGHGDLAEDLILGVDDPPLAGHVLSFG